MVWDWGFGLTRVHIQNVGVESLFWSRPVSHLEVRMWVTLHIYFQTETKASSFKPMLTSLYKENAQPYVRYVCTQRSSQMVRHHITAVNSSLKARGQKKVEWGICLAVSTQVYVYAMEFSGSERERERETHLVILFTVCKPASDGITPIWYLMYGIASWSGPGRCGVQRKS